ncbi:MAG: hypothetical protein ABSF00_08750 [Candidatus Bathyarchaeia archaeon]|jgi:hypothetical protein
MKQDRETNSDGQIEADDHGRLFDPGGLLLVGIVGAGGTVLLLKHSWILGLPCAVLAALGLIASHRHFDPTNRGTLKQIEQSRGGLILGGSQSLVGVGAISSRVCKVLDRK